MSIDPESVQLRPLRESDWRAAHVWASDPQVSRHQAWGPNTEDDTREFVSTAVAEMAQRPRHRWVYAVCVEDQVVGSCELNLRGLGQGEIGYVLRRDRWGQGITSAAARQLLRIAFEEHDLHRVYATCDPRNAASAGVLRRIGMQHEGRLRETLLIQDGWRDSDVYAVLVHEWSDPASEKQPVVSSPSTPG